MTDGITPTMPVAPVANNEGMFGGNMWIWIILLFFLIGGNGFGNRGAEANGATNLINNDFLYTQSKIDSLGQALISQTNQLNQSLNAGINSVTMGMNSGFNGVNMGLCNLGHQIDSGFCNTNRNIDSIRYENAQNTCAITTAIGASTQAILDRINDNTIQDLRDKNVELSAALSNCNQSATLNAALNNALSTRFPYPVPANVVGYQGFGAYPAPFGFDGCRERCNPCC